MMDTEIKKKLKSHAFEATVLTVVLSTIFAIILHGKISIIPLLFGVVAIGSYGDWIRFINKL